ncbi:SdiA-regulated domain-containing protein, partial [Flavobacterium sp.]|uniref:SdiA-regulated domain-containing protein n=1 Tax=Flavobacterium sp. TaxID=239 RepID=UPI00391CDE08
MKNYLHLKSAVFLNAQNFKKKKSNLGFVFFFTLLFSLFGFVQNATSQTTISQWTFEPLQGTNANPTPNTGSGSATLVGSMTGVATATGMLLSGSGCGAQSGANPGAWAIATANPGTTNESSGAQFNVSTVGRSGIIVQWDQRFSNSSTNTVRLQYTTDGTTWNNFTMTASNTTLCAGSLNNGRFENNAGDVYRRVIVNLSAITAVDNNANFGFRAVAAHYQSTGQFRQSNTPASVATGGTWRFDNVTVSGTVIPSNPAVNLSVSANSGTEAGTTAITVTATASSAVTGDQTLALGVSGTNITTGDYSLSNSTITILNGQTTGSVTFTVVDDAVVETTETATLTISSPSAGIILGTTTTQNIAITDNDVSANPTVALSVNSNTGSEAGTTLITITATASSAVSGDQTVSLGVSGTNITAGDYTLSNSTITILNGQTTGSVTFTVTDDALVESTETATLTISSPSAGITLGTTTTQNIAITDNDSASTIDLSTYVRVGRYDLPEPTRTVAPTNNLLCQEASAVAYNWDTDTLFITADGSTSVTQVSKTGVLIDTMTMALGGSPQGTDFYDTEGLTYIGGGQFVMSEERDRQLVKFTYAAGTTLTRANTQTVKIGTFVPNTGTEGLCYDPITGGFICLKEIDPIGIFQTNVDFAAGTATNGSPTTVNSVNLFDPALLGFIDVADVFVLANIPTQSTSPNLLVLSQENAQVVNIDRNGNIASTLTIVTDPGNPLNVASQQHEGITMDNNGNIYIVSENGGGDINHPQLWVYAPSTTPNQAPTAIALTNTVPSIIENSITTPAVRVADILLTDDGLGTNTYSLSGADANNFQITASSLFIKPGTVLDFETKSTYNVTVNVDDTTVGATPDASVNFVLSVTDLVNETPQLPNVTISEVAPWGSGNSPAAADWFEVTNNGTTALNISGWKVDDSSNSFAASLALTGITSIAPGESVIFLESSASNPAATVVANFKSLWFGANPPASLQVGTYQGSGIGLSTGGDAVNLYDASGVLQANVIFGASPTVLFKTFNNAVGLNNTTISLLSEVGVNDAFVAVNDVAEIGSPGSVGRLFISEVAPWSSGNSPVGADWFEVTNTKAVAVDITGWKVDDSSQSPAAAVALNGITSINPGESVIFIETNDLPGKTTAFLNNWFGTNPTGGLRIGNYTGSGIGLGTGGDQVNLYNTTSSTPQTSVLFGSSPAAAPYTTFDNKAGVNSLVTPITQFSAVSVNGAFIAANSTNEIGSPGTIITAPCPTITATATPALSTVCFGATTTVTVTATGGTLPYTVSGSPLTVGGGTFTYTITDAKGCTATATTTVTSLPAATVDLSVTTNTASETAATIVTVTATATAPVCVNETISLGVSGTGITAADYTLSNATITIPSGSTSGSVTFTVVSDNAVEPLETATLTISNPSSGIVLGTTTTQNIAISDFVFTLQVLHASDFEGAVEAVQDAPRFAAIVDQLEESYVNTIKLSSGDNYIPGPFLSSGGDPTLAPVYKTAYENFYNTTFTSPPVNLAVSIGRADISIMNFIGIEASALGNHEFDLGTNEIRTMIAGANNTGATTTTWYGAQFPYLSSNLNFSGDSNLASISTTNRLRLNTSFMSSPTETPAAISAKTKLAPSTIIMKGGQKIGIVGCTTQILASISSPGATTVIGGGANDMNILAGIVQPTVDALIADGCNKVILLSHLQQIAFEQDLATKLTGVDIIIAAGSNTLLADANDRLRAGDVAAGTYPFLATDLAGRTVPVVNTDGNYKYVGRLVVDFDSDGNLLPASINDAISGVYATDQQGLNDVWGANVGNAFLPGTRGYQVQLLCNAIGNVINSKDGNLFGKTSVFLEGRRNFVRTEETNLGNITSEANLWLAKFYDPTTVISIKNGGGIRSAIGNVIAVGDNVTLVPPIANPGAGKQSGDISQLDIENSLRFNNQLSLMTLTASGLRAILEHAVNATTATATPGQFAQVAGVRYSYNFSNASGSKILNAVITDSAGNVIDTLVVNGVTVGNLSRTFRVVTLNFLAGNGDGYPFVASSVPGSRLDLNTVPEQGPAMASFANSGSEQDAFAEYMKNQFSTTPYGIADTPLVNDCRIQRVPARTDNVLPPNAGTNGTLSICTGTTLTTAQLFSALGGTPQTGGIWSPALAGAGVYTYTVTSPSCSGSASATVIVSETPQPLWYLDADGDGYYTGAAVPSCTSPGAGYTNAILTGGNDCNDAVATINPGRTEICWNNIDDDCDGLFSEGCTPVVVNMATANSTVLPSFATAVSAQPYTFAGATTATYRFTIVNLQTLESQEVTSPTRFVAIPVSMRNFNVSYTVTAAAVIDGENVPYAGNTITVLSPIVPKIKLTGSSCNVTLTSLSTSISSTVGTNAISYTFRARLTSDNGPTPTYYFVTSPSRFVNLASFVGLVPQFGTSYTIDVQYTFLD